MKSPLVLIGLAGGAYFLTKKKTPVTSTKKPTTEIKPVPKPAEIELKSPKTEESELPPVEDKDKPVEEIEEKIEDIKLVKDYYDPYFSETNSAPMVMDANSIWISNDCLSWGVGKNYKIALPEKYLYTDAKNPDKLVTPWEWWNKVGGTMSPAPWYLNDLMSDSPPRAFASNLIDMWNKCPISPPRRKDFKTFDEYRMVTDKFITTPLGKLMVYLVDRIQNEMYSNWEMKYPKEAEIEVLRGWALQAIYQNPTKTTDEQTNIAWHLAFDNSPNAPKKIDPKNPNHKPYLDAWMRLSVEVKNYKGLIKQYGM